MFATLEALLTKLHAKLFDANNAFVTWVDVDDLHRMVGDVYQRRSIVFRGRKFVEPEAEALEYAPADEWHEVAA